MLSLVSTWVGDCSSVVWVLLSRLGWGCTEPLVWTTLGTTWGRCHNWVGVPGIPWYVTSRGSAVCFHSWITVADMTQKYVAKTFKDNLVFFQAGIQSFVVPIPEEVPGWAHGEHSFPNQMESGRIQWNGGRSQTQSCTKRLKHPSINHQLTNPINLLTMTSSKARKSKYIHYT